MYAGNNRSTYYDLNNKLEAGLIPDASVPGTGVDTDPLRNIERLMENPTYLSEFQDLLNYRLNNLSMVPRDMELPFNCPLELHAQYTRDELLAGIGYWSLSKQPEMRQGVVYSRQTNADLFLVTLNKTETDYSPTTMYADYAISDTLFHWQSKSQTSDKDPTGQRYINHARNGSTVLLCVREDRLTNGQSNPFYFLGPADFVSYTGSRPMSIVWKLRYPMPAKLVRQTVRLAVA